MSLNYPKENRIFEDMQNTNSRFYRESECHAKRPRSHWNPGGLRFRKEDL